MRLLLSALCGLLLAGGAFAQDKGPVDLLCSVELEGRGLMASTFERKTGIRVNMIRESTGDEIGAMSLVKGARNAEAALPALPPPAAGAPVALPPSPQPDDEGLTGGWPLRLRETDWRVFHLAVALGGAMGRRARRRQELQEASSMRDWRPRALPDEGSGRRVAIDEDAAAAL